jgi:hypothetical protein
LNTVNPAYLSTWNFSKIKSIVLRISGMVNGEFEFIYNPRKDEILDIQKYFHVGKLILIHEKLKYTFEDAYCEFLGAVIGIDSCGRITATMHFACNKFTVESLVINNSN